MKMLKISQVFPKGRRLESSEDINYILMISWRILFFSFHFLRKKFKWMAVFHLTSTVKNKLRKMFFLLIIYCISKKPKKKTLKHNQIIQI